jgi:hypothetical protein
MYVHAVRSIVATLLVVLLFSGASLACGFSQLQQAKPLCTSASADHAAMSMSCEHCRGVNRPAATSACGMSNDTSAIPMRARANEDTWHSLTNQHPTTVAQMVSVSPDITVSDGWRKDPPGTIAALHPLFVSLRI